ncbi:MAG: amidohydrolase family protein [Humibacillus sp.]|nr:amidohydrolase family protein [Humibacillus sp.]MDN5777198.1 amidohydrolase family protein [Humibacillus sp.]
MPSSTLSPGGRFDARWLDEAVPDRPVMLRAWDDHTVWVNTRALELAGITASTPDPVLGEIPHRDDGSVLGTLREWGAIDLIEVVMPPRTLEARVSAIERAGRHYASLGITWVQDAWVEPEHLEAYLAAGRRLAMRLGGARRARGGSRHGAGLLTNRSPGSTPSTTRRQASTPDEMASAKHSAVSNDMSSDSTTWPMRS